MLILCMIATFFSSRRSLPAEAGDDIELKSVQLQFPSARTLDKNADLYQVSIDWIFLWVV